MPRVYADFLRTVQQLASKTAAPPYESAPKIVHHNDLIDVSELTIGALTSNPASSSKRVTVAAVNDDDSGSDSDVSEGSVNRYIEDHPEIDWRTGITTSVWK